jgi:hypothetical protein
LLIAAICIIPTSMKRKEKAHDGADRVMDTPPPAAEETRKQEGRETGRT